MSYLYELCDKFYEKMKDLTNDDDDFDNKYFKYSSDSIDKETNSLYNKIVIHDEGYYRLLLDIVNYYHFVDLDLLCDCITECTYEKLPLIKDNEELNKKIKEFQKLENQKLKYTIYKLIKSFECLRIFINTARHKYLDDFFRECNPKKVMYNFLYGLLYKNKINEITLHKSDYKKNSSISVLINNIINRKMDFISSFVDSNECKDLILSQQQYYVNELERLLDKIKDMGNRTGLNSEKFEVFLNFIYSMKEYALEKIAAINDIEKEFSKKNDVFY